MALARQCDICGRLYEPYNIVKNGSEANGIVFVNINNDRTYHAHEAKDCCPECMEAIKERIESLKRKAINIDAVFESKRFG